MKTHKSLVKIVANAAPWLTPAPSAFFVARAAITHLVVPWYISIVIAAVIEMTGIATAHTALWLYDWNANKRKTDQAAPVGLAVGLGVIYVLATVGLTVVLEVAPGLAVIAPALFPAMVVVGAIDLALISQQEAREFQAAHEKQERSAQRAQSKASREAPEYAGRGALDPALRGERIERITEINRSRTQRKAELIEQLIDAYRGNPNLGATDAGRALGVHRNTVYAYTGELEAAGRIKRNGEGVEVLG